MPKIPVPEFAAAALPEAARGIALAISGGADSMALLAAARARAGDDPRLGAAWVLHVDHGLRPGSAAAARTVVALAESLGFRARILEIADRPPEQGSIEAWARARRYALLEGAMAELGLDLLLTAHHRDDQAETVALALMRGAQAGGLAGMAPLRPLSSAGRLLGRPFLDQSRARLADYLRGTGLHAIDDESNRHLGPRRNLIRHLVLESATGPSVDRLLDLGRRAAAAEARLRRWAEARLDPPGSAAYARASARAGDLATLPIAFRGALVRALLHRLGRSELAPGRRALAALDRDRTVELARDCHLHRQGDRLLLVVRRDAPAATVTRLEIDERVRPLPQGGGLQLRTVADGEEFEPGLRRQPLPRDRLDGPLTLRTVERDERFRPFGMDGRRRATDLLREAGLDADRRAGFLAVADDRGILWLPGIRAAERCRCRRHDRRLLLELLD
ncbi:MAG: tRNA lysidine(34) synthetase TilS [Planctomycetes bacterium]|nr:tRNA lysidine(34) synthetase TilS [Planctomycetota bacterium]